MIVYGLKALFPDQKGNIRDLRPVWALEEIGVPYELVLLNPKKNEHKAVEFLRLNPLGKVPAIQDGDFTLFESTAICTYIGEKYGKLVPDADETLKRAVYNQWLSFIVTSIESHTGRIFACDFFSEKDDQNKHLRKFAIQMANRFMPIVDKHLEANSFLLGKDFSMVDIALTTSLNFVKHTDLLKPFLNLSSYLEKNYQRLGYQKALSLNASPAE